MMNAERPLFGRFTAVFSSWTRLQHAILNRVRLIPFALGLPSLFPGTYRAYVPDRYWSTDHKGVRLDGRNKLGREKFCSGNGMNNRGDMPRYYFFRLLAEQIAKESIKGDVAELGVYKGNTAVLLAEIARDSGTNAFLFDTFGGFSAQDLVGIDADKTSGAQFDDTSLQRVRDIVGDANTFYIKGRFPESLSQVPADLKFSVVHIDCDLYAPFRAALDYFYPRLMSGGFLVMHDYSSGSWDGAESAVDEFFTGKPEHIIPLPDKSGTAVVRKM